MDISELMDVMLWILENNFVNWIQENGVLPDISLTVGNFLCVEFVPFFAQI